MKLLICIKCNLSNILRRKIEAEKREAVRQKDRDTHTEFYT